MFKLSALLAVGCVLLLAAHPLNAEGEEASTEVTVEPTTVETTVAPPADTDETTTMASEEETSTESTETSSSDDPTTTAMSETSTTTRSRVKVKRPFPNLAPYDRPTPDRDDAMLPNKNNKDNKFLLIIPFPKMDSFPPSPSRSPSPWSARPQYGASDDEDSNPRRTGRPMKMPFPNFAPYPSYSPYPRRQSPWSSRRPPIDDDDNIKISRGGEDSDDDDYRKTIVKRYQRFVDDLNQEKSSPLLARIVRSATSLDSNGNTVNKVGGVDTAERPKRCSKSRNGTDTTAAGDSATRKNRSGEVEETDVAGSVDPKSRPKPKKYRMRAPKMSTEIAEDVDEETTTTSATVAA